MPLSGASSASGRSACTEGGATGAFMGRSLRRAKPSPPAPAMASANGRSSGKRKPPIAFADGLYGNRSALGRAGAQEVADLGEKLHVRRHLRLLRGIDLRVLLALQPVHALDG